MNNAIESIFISHGAPTFALEPGLPGTALQKVGRALVEQGTQTLIVFSPHWRSAKLAVTTHEAPVVVHDFYGFPAELYELKPEIPGHPELAHALCKSLLEKGLPVDTRPQQGFDHGAWVPYLHLFPHGGMKMLQISMPVNWNGETAFGVGQLLGQFAREHDAVVVGSGSLTHNFGDMDLSASEGEAMKVPGYVNEFTAWVKEKLADVNHSAIAQAEYDAPHFSRAHPDDDHYLPLPFALGATSAQAQVECLPEDVRYGALSMQSFVFRKAG